MKSYTNVIVFYGTDALEKCKRVYVHCIFVSLIYETKIIRYNKFIEIEWCIYICI